MRAGSRGRGGGASLAAAVLLAAAIPSVARAETWLRTGVREADCRAPAAATQAAYAARGLAVVECPAPKGWALFLVSTPERSWLDIRDGGTAWSTEDAIVRRAPIGEFPNVGGAPVVEWWIAAEGRPRALVFRVVALAPPEAAAGPRQKRVSRLVAVRLGDPENVNDPGPCLLGVAVDNAEARRLATSGNCLTPLPPVPPVDPAGAKTQR